MGGEGVAVWDRGSKKRAFFIQTLILAGFVCFLLAFQYMRWTQPSAEEITCIK